MIAYRMAQTPMQRVEAETADGFHRLQLLSRRISIDCAIFSHFALQCGSCKQWGPMMTQ